MPPDTQGAGAVTRSVPRRSTPLASRRSSWSSMLRRSHWCLAGSRAPWSRWCRGSALLRPCDVPDRVPQSRLRSPEQRDRTADPHVNPNPCAGALWSSSQDLLGHTC